MAVDLNSAAFKDTAWEIQKVADSANFPRILHITWEPWIHINILLILYKNAREIFENVIELSHFLPHYI